MRLLGIFLLSSVPLFFFYHQGEEAKQGLRLRKGVLSLFTALEMQIRHFDRDQREIFDTFQDSALEKIGFLAALQQEVRDAPCGAFGRVMASFLPRLSYGTDAGEMLLTVSERFGLQAKEDQLKDLSATISLLEKEREKEQVEVQNKVKILRMVGLSAGLGIWILLI